MLSRRTFLKGVTVGAAGLAVGTAARDMAPDGYTGTPIVERLSLAIRGLPKQFDGYKIGFLTDLHLGIWAPRSWITHALETLISANVELLLLGGDYIYVSDTPIWNAARCVRNHDYVGMKRPAMAAKAFADVLGLIAPYSFRDGIVGVVGNHEHWNSYALFADAAKRFPSINILMNEETSITRDGAALDILGVDDYLTGFPIKPPPRRGPPSERPRILLSHNPDFVAAVLEDGPPSFDIALCGHTHGGQIRIPGLTGVVIPVQDPRFMSGLTTVDGAHIYTSRGLGVVGLPFRVNCPPEITIIELQSR